MLLMFVLTVAFAMPEANAQSRQLRKALKKEYKAKRKEFKKGGWEIYASTRSLDVALLSYYEELKALGEDAYPLTGVAPRFKSKNIGKNEAYQHQHPGCEGTGRAYRQNLRVCSRALQESESDSSC